MNKPNLVVDTNVFVSAGFSPRSPSGRIIAGIATERFSLIWSQATREEIQRVLWKIPPLGKWAWKNFGPLFRKESEYSEKLALERFSGVQDENDRRFVALSAVSGSILVTKDPRLIVLRTRLGIQIELPEELLET